MRLSELAAACDWRGVVALEQEALALAGELRGADSETASAILNMLGLAFRNVGDYGRAREVHLAHAPAGLTAQQRRLWTRLDELQDAHD